MNTKCNRLIIPESLLPAISVGCNIEFKTLDLDTWSSMLNKNVDIMLLRFVRYMNTSPKGDISYGMHQIDLGERAIIDSILARKERIDLYQYNIDVTPEAERTSENRYSIRVDDVKNNESDRYHSSTHPLHLIRKMIHPGVSGWIISRQILPDLKDPTCRQIRWHFLIRH